MATALFSDLVCAFAELSKRLLELDAKMVSLKILSGGFGSWETIVEKGKEAVKFEFDGKDSILYLSLSPVRPSRVPNEWSKLGQKPFPQRKKSEIAYAEEFLRNRFSN